MPRHLVSLALMGVFAVAGCGTGGSLLSPPNGAGPTLLSISPSSGATGVDPSVPITLAFSHPMMVGMEMLVAVHEGTVTGATIAGTSIWSADRTRLTFTPSEPLKPRMTYVVHLSPNLKDGGGHAIDLAACAQSVGGSAVAGSMMSGGTMGPGMTGAGWQPGSGVWGYGMFFVFTTA